MKIGLADKEVYLPQPGDMAYDDDGLPLLCTATLQVQGQRYDCEYQDGHSSPHRCDVYDAEAGPYTVIWADDPDSRAEYDFSKAQQAPGKPHRTVVRYETHDA